MKFLMCGLGSIGQRHVRIIKKILGKKAQIAAFRSRNQQIIINDNIEAQFDTNPEIFYGLTSFYDFNEALQWQPDVVFVTNPISLHLETALKAVNAGCHVFIEKPLSENLQGIQELHDIVKEKSLICMVGYQMRFHPGLLKIKDLVSSGRLGKIVFADIHFGEWLPGMHPYEDYRQSHAARSDQGGGVIRCLSHEIDYAYWLFGLPDKVYAAGGSLGDLELDVEDTADIIFRYGLESNEFAVHLHLDFLQKPARRYCQIVGSRAALFWDYYKNELIISEPEKDSTKTIDYSGFMRNEMFEKEVAHFIESINDGKEPSINLQEGINTMKICGAALKSLKSGKLEAV